MPTFKYLLLPITYMLISAMVSCQGKSPKKNEFLNSDMYDLANPTIINLPQKLDEISGLAYYPKDTSVFAIIDEDGLLFKIPIKQPDHLKEWTFDKKRDYEDVILKDSVFYTLVSNGDIVAVHFGGDSITTDKLEFPGANKKTNEFETIYYDDSTSRMVIMCKDCEEDKKAKVSTFYFDDSAKSFLPYIQIDVAPIAKKLGMVKLSLKPSAAAINPATKELYILCSVNKLLVIADRNGNFKEAYKLDPEIYKQPEGMAFTPAGDLIISNERNLEGYATLLILKNKKKGK